MKEDKNIKESTNYPSVSKSAKLRHRFFSWLIISCLAFLALVALMLTPLGLIITAEIAKQMIPGELSFRHLSGTLGGAIQAEELHYQHQDINLTVKKLDLRWHPLDLLAGKFSVRKLEIDQAYLYTAENKINIFEELTLPFLLRIPASFSIQSSVINHFVWEYGPHQIMLDLKKNVLKNLNNHSQLNLVFSSEMLKPQPITAVLNIHGPRDHYQIDFKIAETKNTVIIKGQGDQHHFQLQATQAPILKGHVDGQFIYDWQSLINWQLKLNAKHLDLALIYPQWPKELNVQLTTSGHFNYQSNLFAAEYNPIFSWTLALQAPQADLQFNGHYNQHWLLNWKINANDVNRLLPFLNGDLQSEGVFVGKDSMPQTQGTLTSKDLHYRNKEQELILQSIRGQWNFDMNDQHPSNIELTVHQLQSKKFNLQSLHLLAQGDKRSHQIELNAKQQDIQLTSKIIGSLQKSFWQGTIEKLDLSSPHFGLWWLLNTSHLQISKSRIATDSLCLIADTQNQFCLAGNWNQYEKWQSSLKGQINLKRLTTLWDESIILDSPMNIAAEINGEQGKIIQGQLNLKLAKGNFNYHTQQTVFSIPFQGGGFSAALDKQGLMINSQLTWAAHDQLMANIILPNYLYALSANKQPNIHGQVDLSMADWSATKIISSNVMLSGQLQAHFDINGFVNQPNFSGEARLHNGQINIPKLKIELDKMDLEIKAHKKELDYKLQANLAGQPVNIIGKTNLLQSPMSSEFSLEANNLSIINTKEYSFDISPKVNLTIQDHQIVLTGDILIPKAMLQPAELKDVVGSSKNDIVYVNQRQPSVQQPTANPWHFSTHVNLIAGDEIYFNTMGAKGRLTGQVTIIYDPSQTIIGDGRINILDGYYNLHGEKLNLSADSAIIYRHNNFNNPYLNIQAYKNVYINPSSSNYHLAGVDSLMVGLNIGGTVNSPQISLYSQPVRLSQAEILSYLVLGTATIDNIDTSSTTSAANLAILLQAMETLHLGKPGKASSSIADQVRQGLGISELGVQTEEQLGPLGESLGQQNTYIVVGKQLLPHLYVRYKLDPILGTNVFQLNYRLTPHLQLQSETSTLGNGIDMLYSIQTEKKKPLAKKTSPPKTTKTQAKKSEKEHK